MNQNLMADVGTKYVVKLQECQRSLSGGNGRNLITCLKRFEEDVERGAEFLDSLDLQIW